MAPKKAANRTSKRLAGCKTRSRFQEVEKSTAKPKVPKKHDVEERNTGRTKTAKGAKAASLKSGKQSGRAAAAKARATENNVDGADVPDDVFFADRDLAYGFYTRVNDLLDEMNSPFFDQAIKHLSAASRALNAVIEKAGAGKLTPDGKVTKSAKTRGGKVANNAELDEAPSRPRKSSRRR